MQINEEGLNIIKYWERNPKTDTFYDKAYLDCEKVPTIGWGTIRWNMRTPVKLGDTITEDEANRQLLIEVQRIQDAIDESVHVPLNENEYSSLCSLFYNIGTGWCTGKGHQQATFIKNLNKGRRDLVPSGMMQFVRGAKTGAVYDGLIRRRKSEVQLWLTPVEDEVAIHDHDQPVTMPQAVTQDTGYVRDAVKESWTIRGAVAAILGGILQGWNWLFETAKEAGAEVLAIKQATGPFDALFAALKANMGFIAAGIVVTGGCIAIIRRVQAAREGKIG
jgi:lysozyme